MRRRLMSIALLLAVWVSVASLFTMNAVSVQKARAHEIADVKQQYSSDPNERMQEMLTESEGGGPISELWREFLAAKPHTHLTPVDVRGGVGP